MLQKGELIQVSQAETSDVLSSVQHSSSMRHLLSGM